MNFYNLPSSMIHSVIRLADFSWIGQAIPDVATAAEVAQSATASWSPLMLIPILLGAIGYLLIQHGIVHEKPALFFGLIALMIAVGIAIGFVPTSLESLMLMGFCTLATGGGISFLVAREPVYAALGFATAVLSTCGVLFMQSALFIAAATMIVYAGATIIIFLFVLMFAQQTELRSYDIQLSSPSFAGAIGAILLATITLCVTGENAISASGTDLTRPYSQAQIPKEMRTAKAEELFQRTEVEARGIPSTTAGLGRSLYTDYLIAVELAGTVLLVATIGAIALAQRTKESQI
jgi:NADH-quinone oxidoreductase subunit J